MREDKQHEAVLWGSRHFQEKSFTSTRKRCLVETLNLKQNLSGLNVLGPTFKHSESMKYWLGFVNIITHKLKQAEALQSVEDVN